MVFRQARRAWPKVILTAALAAAGNVNITADLEKQRPHVVRFPAFQFRFLRVVFTLVADVRPQDFAALRINRLRPHPIVPPERPVGPPLVPRPRRETLHLTVHCREGYRWSSAKQQMDVLLPTSSFLDPRIQVVGLLSHEPVQSPFLFVFTDERRALLRAFCA